MDRHPWRRLLAGILGLTLVLGVAGWLAFHGRGPENGSPSLLVTESPEAPEPVAAEVPTSFDDLLGGPDLVARTPAEVRAVVGFCRAAQAAGSDELVRAARTSPDPLVAANALEALGRLHRVDVAFLEPFLADERMRVRQAGIVALGAVGEAEAAERLAGLVRPDADPTERALAIRSLGRAGGEGAIARLARLVEREGLTETDRAFLRIARRDAGERIRKPASPGSR